jgi:NitT/TauT family transport system ATP-binding protein
VHVVVDQVVKRFVDPRRGGDVLALDGVSCQIHQREFVSIVGPSGCGKSTLLNILAGFERPTAGTVLVGGQPVRGPGPDRGVVFQEYALFPWLTVEQNIAFGLRNLPLPPATRQRLVRDAIALVGLGGFEGRLPRELSGGMRQRVGLARVLVMNPSVLLLDEPFAALDALTRQLMQDQLMEVWSTTHTTVVLVTHSVDEALVLSDRVYVMSARPGRILQVIDVPLARPRDLASEELNALRARIHRLLAGEVRRSFEEQNALVAGR